MIEMEKLVHRPDYYLDLITLSLDTLRDKYEKAERPKDIIFYGYLYQEKKCFGLDYNDLLTFSLYIFETCPEIRQKWQERLSYIMIDEFQDIDKIQYRLMEVLCGYHKNLFIVGDPDQTIYTWRGADVRYLLDFDQAFPHVKTVMMLENYRSTPEILAVANSLIAKNRHRIEKSLRPTLPSGAPVVCHFARRQDEEAQWIVSEIQGLKKAGIPYREMTVLYRAHYVSRAVEEALLREKVPYTIYSGVQFFQRAEIKDALSYLRMIAYRDDLSFRRVPTAPSATWVSAHGLFGGIRRRARLLSLRGLAPECRHAHLQGHQGRRLSLPHRRFFRRAFRPSCLRGALGHPPREWLRGHAPHRGQPGAAGQPGRAQAVGLRLRNHLRRGGHPGGLPLPRGALHQRRRRRARRQGKAHDRPRGQGAGVSLCIPLRPQRGDLPLEKGAHPPGHGGGAAALLRGPDSGGEGALPLRGRRAELRRLAPLSLPVPAGHRPGAAHLLRALAGRASPGGAGLHRRQRPEGRSPAGSPRPGAAGAPRHFRHRDGAGGGLHPERPRGTV